MQEQGNFCQISPVNGQIEGLGRFVNDIEISEGMMTFSEEKNKIELNGHGRKATDYNYEEGIFKNHLLHGKGKRIEIHYYHGELKPTFNIGIFEEGKLVRFGNY